MCMHADSGIVPDLCRKAPGGHGAASEDDLSDGDHLELEQSRALSGRPEDGTSAGDSDEQNEGTDEQLSAPKVNRKLADLLAEDKINETFLHRGSTLDRKVPTSASAVNLELVCHLHVLWSCVDCSFWISTTSH